MSGQRYLTFSWYDQVYAISIDETIAVIGVQDIVKTNKEELKLTLFKNRVLPVIDALSMFSIEESKPTKESKIIVVEKKGVRVGVIVDTVEGIKTVKNQDIIQPNINEMRFVVNVFKNIKIVDLEYFLEPNILNSIKKAINIDAKSIFKGEKIIKDHWGDREYIVDEIKMEILNFLLESNKRKLGEYYMNSIAKIHQMVDNL